MLFPYMTPIWWITCLPCQTRGCRTWRKGQRHCWWKNAGSHRENPRSRSELELVLIWACLHQWHLSSWSMPSCVKRWKHWEFTFMYFRRKQPVEVKLLLLKVIIITTADKLCDRKRDSFTCWILTHSVCQCWHYKWCTLSPPPLHLQLPLQRLNKTKMLFLY